eukprot:2773265-Amphidinium_carterae.1
MAFSSSKEVVRASHSFSWTVLTTCISFNYAQIITETRQSLKLIAFSRWVFPTFKIVCIHSLVKKRSRVDFQVGAT